MSEPLGSGPTEPPGPPLGYRELLVGNPSFRALWAGQVVSLLGDWFSLIASAALIGQLTGSGLAVGSLFIVRMLAPFVVAPLAGVCADRLDRKTILIVTDVIRAVVTCGFLFVRDPADVWLLYAVSALQLAVSGLYTPAHTAILPDIVPGRGLGAANALSSATWSVMLAVGAALGGVVSGAWGIYPAFVIDAATFLVSAAILTRLRPASAPAPLGAGAPSGAFGQFVDGLRYLTRHRDIAITALQKPCLLLFAASGMEVARVTIGTEVFPLGKGGGVALGLMYAAIGFGTGLGPVLARRLTGDRPATLRQAILLAYGVSCAGMLVTSSLAGFGWVLAGVLLRGTGSGLIWVFSTQLLLQSVRGDVRGRVFSTEGALTTLAGAGGAALGGQLLDALPLATTIRVMAAGALLPGALWAWWIWRRPFAEGGAPG